MPIRSELRKFYRGPEYKATRVRILARAGNCCERCGKPNGAIVESVTWKSKGQYFMVWRCADRVMQPANPTGKSPLWTSCERQAVEPAWLSPTGYFTAKLRPRDVIVVLTMAHLNHVSGDDRDENLAAWCQWCHLVYDLPHHAETRAERKDAARPLLTQCA